MSAQASPPAHPKVFSLLGGRPKNCSGHSVNGLKSPAPSLRLGAAQSSPTLGTESLGTASCMATSITLSQSPALGAKMGWELPTQQLG